MCLRLPGPDQQCGTWKHLPVTLLWKVLAGLIEALEAALLG